MNIWGSRIASPIGCRSLIVRSLSSVGNGTLTTWVPRFAPAIVSRAAHGLIRTAHAARSLSVSDTAPRRRELAQGLGYWASTWQTLPGEPSETDSPEFPSDAMERLRRLHEPGFVNQGLIWQSLLRLHDEPSFAGRDTPGASWPGCVGLPLESD